VIVRDATDADMAAVQRIYAHEVLHGLASFEEVPPTTEELLARRAAVLAAGLPYLVAELDGQIVGYCYATSYRPRPAYRHTVEDSVYVADGAQGRGVGRRLLSVLIERCQAGAARQMIAVIGDSGNTGSIALHSALGFRHVGTFTAVGFKFGRWVDSVLMQRELGSATVSPRIGASRTPARRSTACADRRAGFAR
jgi:L-amino acid N-acyltransferase YncA